MLSSADSLTAQNAEIFFDPSLPDWYSRQGLCEAETVLLIRYRDAFSGRSVLDLGVGSGRTTRFLLPFAERYTGVDLSPVMLATAKRAFPSAEFLALDICNLDALSGRSYDFVSAPWAVLDAISHEARLLLLSRVRSMLPPDGLFIFSAHNRDGELAGRPPELNYSASPDKMARNLAHHALALRNYLQRKHLRREEPEYAFFNDMAHRWKGVFYYISRDAQQRQIEQAGFELVEIVGEDGRTLDRSDRGRRDGCLHYVCRKPAGVAPSRH